ncbi:hypothetical protein [Solimonas sp. K1W22B-7]|uniref:hypothetical protein n=1 Tax=Solimonas sp. K1W22B-7 TaxID=2303331 RepID=UPI0013C5202F|nr:hypothetical protein [Solimonas sp. K1W22B-7]
MRLRPRHSILLALALLLGQWLSFAHQLQHPALNGDVDCEFCVHAQNLASGAPAAGSAAPQFAATQEAPGVLAVAVAASRPAALIRIRGPPMTLA